MILSNLGGGKMQETGTLKPLTKDTIRLLRIPFSLFLMPVYLLALSQAEPVSCFLALSSFILVHFLVYPASNGYNSYVDKDKSSVGGLESPPQPTRQLLYTTIAMDIIALIAALFF